MEIASSLAIAGVLSEQAIPEPVSPELVLVDPELRRALQARALAPPPLQVVPAEDPVVHAFGSALEATAASPVAAQPSVLWPVPATAAPEAGQPERRGALAQARRRLVRVVLPISLALNAILIALAVTDARAPQPSARRATTSALSNPPASTNAQPKPKSKPKQAGKKPAPKRSKTQGSRRRAAAAGGVRRNAVVERKLLNLVVQSPAGKLPKALIDPKTGLAKNNLQAVCRRESGSQSFLCVVQPAAHKPGEGAYVRYRLNRKRNGGTFTWYRYRRG